jgi:threonine synthase
MKYGLACVNCGREFESSEKIYLCPYCGMREVDGICTFIGLLRVFYDMKAVSAKINRHVLENRRPGLWKYLELLPVHDERMIVTLGEGGTPLIRSESLAEELGLANLYLKNEILTPTGCFKDRENSIVVSKAKELGFKVIACASTGSLAASLAAYSRRGKMRSFVFVPASTPSAKTIHMTMCGANVIAVKSIYEIALKLQIEACERYRWYNCSSGINPFRIEGDKTIAFEIIEDLGWQSPDWIFIPTGGGGNLSGEWKGFNEFYQLGLISSLPRMVAVQMSAGASLTDAFLKAKEAVEPIPIGNSIGEALLSAYADYGSIALSSLRDSGGKALLVTDDEVLEAQKLLAMTEGIFAEPSSAAVIAGLKKMADNHEIGKEEKVVCLITGNGLKDLSTASKIAGKPVVIKPFIEDLDIALDSLDGVQSL